MNKQVEQVREFRSRFKLPIGSESTQGMRHVNHALHNKLISEEFQEMIEANNLTERCDAIIDQMYLLIGYALDLGVADRLEDMFTEVHESNMSKLGPDGKPMYREDGKVLKGPNYFRPDLNKIVWTKQS
jgi:predicted HAD superfamily Cof-like phosphohydrolase